EAGPSRPLRLRQDSGLPGHAMSSPTPSSAATTGVEPERLGAGAYVVGGLSLVPFLGLPFGVVAIIWGLETTKADGKRLAAIGTGGMIFSFAILAVWFYGAVLQRGGTYDGLRQK